MIAALVIAGWSTLASPAQSTPALEQAIKLFDNFEDAKAAAAFRTILAAKPPSRVAARAHLYLGLIAFNARDPDLAQTEFRAALNVDSAVEAPEGSPKVRMALEQARRELRRELEADAARPLPQQPSAPVAATSVELAEVTEPRRSHALALTLGSVALAAAAVSIVGAVEVAGFNSSMAQAVLHPKTVSDTSAIGQRATAETWQIVAIVSAIAGMAGVTGAVLTW